MKKSLSPFFLLVILGVAGAAVYFGGKGFYGLGTASAVENLPADTLVLLSVPDLGQTANAWKTTDLYKIWSEPEVQDFLAKPLSQLPTNADFSEARARIAKLQPKNLFVALTALDEKNGQPHLVAGFQFKGSSADVDALLVKPKDQLRQHFPAGRADLINYQGHSIETFDAGDGNVLASVYLGDQYLVANDLALLKSTVDRMEHRAPAADQPALGKEPDFQAATAKLPTGPDTLIFARVQPFLNRIFALSAASGQAVDPTQRAEAEKFRAVAASTRIEHGQIRDTIYCLAPGHAQPPGSLKLGALPLTTTDTLFFGASIVNLPAHIDLPANAMANIPGAEGLAGLRGLAAMLDAHGVKLADLHAAFGDELTLQIEWPAASARPALLASLDIRDPVAAGKFVDNLTKTLDSDAAWQASQGDGFVLHTLASPGFSLINPTLTLTGQHFILGLNAPEVRAAAPREKSSGPNFTQSEAYKAASATVEKPNVAFAYLDSRAFFERFYGALKPVALLGTAFVYPQAGEYVDLGKLPAAESISRHLSPTVFSETSDEQGWRVESVGSFTFGEAAAVIAGGAGAAAVPYLEQHGFAPQPPASSTPAQPGTNQ